MTTYHERADRHVRLAPKASGLPEVSNRLGRADGVNIDIKLDDTARATGRYCPESLSKIICGRDFYS